MQNNWFGASFHRATRIGSEQFGAMLHDDFVRYEAIVKTNKLKPSN